MYFGFAGIAGLIWLGFQIGTAFGVLFGFGFGVIWIASVAAFIWMYDNNPESDYGKEIAFALLGGPISFLILLFLRIKNRKKVAEIRRNWADMPYAGLR